MKLEKLVEKLNTKFIGDGGALKVKINKYSITNWADPYYIVDCWFEREVARFCVGGRLKENIERIYMDGNMVDENIKTDGVIHPYLGATDGKCNYFEIFEDNYSMDKFVARFYKKRVVLYDTTKYGVEGEADQKVLEIVKL